MKKISGTAYVIGDEKLHGILREEGVISNDQNPDYVIVGNTCDYTFQNMIRAAYHVSHGAKLIATAIEEEDIWERPIVPACRALVGMVEKKTGVKAEVLEVQ